MIHEAIATGNTIDEALENAKKQLNAPADADVRTEIIAMPQKKNSRLIRRFTCKG